MTSPPGVEPRTFGVRVRPPDLIQLGNFTNRAGIDLITSIGYLPAKAKILSLERSLASFRNRFCAVLDRSMAIISDTPLRRESLVRSVLIDVDPRTQTGLFEGGQ